MHAAAGGRNASGPGLTRYVVLMIPSPQVRLPRDCSPFFRVDSTRQWPHGGGKRTYGSAARWDCRPTTGRADGMLQGGGLLSDVLDRAVGQYHGGKQFGLPGGAR